LCDLDTAFFPELFPLPDMAIPTKTLQNHKPLKPREKKHKEEEKN
jgi:hypothetical protein